MSERRDTYRERYRREHIGAHYSGPAHLAVANVGTLTLAALALSRLQDIQAWEWLTLPVAFLIANGAEYLGHRYPMHHKVAGLGSMCVRHAGRHHRFFTYERMDTEGTRDWHIILFPPHIMAFFVLGIAAPLAALLFWLSTANVAWLFVLVAALYVLTYEWLHLAYHQPPESFLGRRPLVRRLRNLHRVHHDPGTMTKANFNITFPIFDLLLGTYRHAPCPAAYDRRAGSGASVDQE